MMRTSMVAVTMAVLTALFAPAVVIARLLGVPDGPRSFYQRIMHAWTRAVCRTAGVTVRLHNAERMQRGIGDERGVVYASNHVSWFDIFALASVLPRYSFVAKSELRRIPLFGWGAEATGIIFLERENRKAAFESYKVAAAEVDR